MIHVLYFWDLQEEWWQSFQTAVPNSSLFGKRDLKITLVLVIFHEGFTKQSQIQFSIEFEDSVCPFLW